jgi:curved DNA-binding protein CbpA
MNKENPNAQKKFVEATSAYEILRDTKKRQEYDGMRRMRSSRCELTLLVTHASPPPHTHTYHRTRHTTH